MTRRQYIALAAVGSAAMLLGAFAFQYIGGLAPCEMCLWQRWPHGIAAGLGVLALLAPATPLILAGALAATVTGSIGVYHAGVEQGWWEGPNTCTTGDITGVSADQLLDQILAAPLVHCDEIAWQMLGISMAGWNAIISFGLALIWLGALRRR